MSTTRKKPVKTTSISKHTLSTERKHINDSKCIYRILHYRESNQHFKNADDNTRTKLLKLTSHLLPLLNIVDKSIDPDTSSISISKLSSYGLTPFDAQKTLTSYFKIITDNAEELGVSRLYPNISSQETVFHISDNGHLPESPICKECNVGLMLINDATGNKICNECNYTISNISVVKRNILSTVLMTAQSNPNISSCKLGGGVTSKINNFMVQNLTSMNTPTNIGFLTNCIKQNNTSKSSTHCTDFINFINQFQNPVSKHITDEHMVLISNYLKQRNSINIKTLSYPQLYNCIKAIVNEQKSNGIPTKLANITDCQIIYIRYKLGLTFTPLTPSEHSTFYDIFNTYHKRTLYSIPPSDRKKPTPISTIIPVFFATLCIHFNRRDLLPFIPHRKIDQFSINYPEIVDFKNEIKTKIAQLGMTKDGIESINKQV